MAEIINTSEVKTAPPASEVSNRFFLALERMQVDHTLRREVSLLLGVAVGAMASQSELLFTDDIMQIVTGVAVGILVDGAIRTKILDESILAWRESAYLAIKNALVGVILFTLLSVVPASVQSVADYQKQQAVAYEQTMTAAPSETPTPTFTPSPTKTEAPPPTSTTVPSPAPDAKQIYQQQLAVAIQQGDSEAANTVAEKYIDTLTTTAATKGRLEGLLAGIGLTGVVAWLGRRRR